MKVLDIRDKEGRVFAFEVYSALLGRRGACGVVRSIPGARIIREYRLFSWSPDEFCEFELGGVTFVIDEPWGDNDRYWIGTRPPRAVPEIEHVRGAFLRKKTTMRAAVFLMVFLLAVLSTISR